MERERERSEQRATVPATEKYAAQAKRARLVEAFTGRFVNRADWYALQRNDGSYVAVKGRMIPRLIERHLQGVITLGVYALDAQGRARWLCVDADDQQSWDVLGHLAERLRSEGIGTCLEASRRGGHLWLFFAEPLGGKTVRRFAVALIDGRVAKVEVFPKQDGAGSGPGSLVRLPLGRHRKTGQCYPLLNPSGEAVADGVGEQLAYLAHVAFVPTAYVAATLADSLGRGRNVMSVGVIEQRASKGLNAIQRIKESVDIYGFIAQYVPLTQSGRGHCPFHDDAHRSFSVNRAGGYFNCFAGCGGGDVIIFWERYRRISRSEAIRELTRLLPSAGSANRGQSQDGV